MKSAPMFSLRSVPLLLPLILIFLSGCATHYQGSGPDFSLRGEEAKSEVERYSFTESYWLQRQKAFEMGPEGRRGVYWSDSLKPMINEVSPAAYDQLKKANWWTKFQLIPLGIALGALALEKPRSHLEGPFSSRPIFWSAMGAFSISSFYQFSQMQKTAKIYNRDLKSRFAPKIKPDVGTSDTEAEQ